MTNKTEVVKQSRVQQFKTLTNGGFMMKKRFTLLLAMMLALGLIAIPAASADGTQTAVQLGTTSAPYGFYEYLPIGYDDDPNELWPVVIFLHGAGEKGNGTTELYKVLVNGPPKNINNGTHYPAIVISPQSPGWWNVNNLDLMVEYVKSNYRVDLDRIYMTGLSMGGGGTWSYAAAHADKLAAIVPIAGADTNPRGHLTKDVPTWAFHAWGDTTVSAMQSVNWINSIAGAILGSSPTDLLANYPGTYTGLPGSGQTSDKTRTANFDPVNGWVWTDGVIQTAGSHPSLTLYRNASHNSWQATYDNQDMWDWLLAQSQDGSTPPPNLQVITPFGAGQASGSAYFPMQFAFDAQPTLNAAGEPQGGVGGSDAPYYKSRYGYIDFGPDWSDIRITATWTQYRQWSNGDQAPFVTVWWDDDTDIVNDSGLTETSLNFNSATGLSTGTTMPWIQDSDLSAAPVTPKARYLVLGSDSDMTGRAKEYAIIGWIE